LTQGCYHEVHVLFSPDRQWGCIARLSRSIESTGKLSGELATIKYVWAQTQIPVPEVYCHDLSPTKFVGMQFIAMEHIPGRHLYQIWDDLTVDHKKATLSQIAAVLGQLAQLKFPRIGSLQEDFKLGSMLRMNNQVDDPKNSVTVASGPFISTCDYLASVIEGKIIHHRISEGEDVDSLLFDVKSILQAYNVQRASSSSIRPPFRLPHADFDGQNMLFTDPKHTNGAPPRLTGVIDWEYAHAAPVYFLYELPHIHPRQRWRKERLRHECHP
jgi:aminoglycoside phosphotransferase (APT) family kinase protein